MRINGVAGGFDGGIVDRIMDSERAPVEALKERRGRVVNQKNEYSSLNGMLGELGNAARGMQLPTGFRQLKFESSHPDILEGVIDGAATPGTFEMEVRGLASADKHLDVGFPDRDKTGVGFGHMQVEADGQNHEVIINPGATLNDVVNRINSSGAGVKASVINTGFAEDPYKLLVVSEKTGEAAKINLDEDTTFLDMKNVKAARNLDARFEDVDVTRAGNKLDDLVDGVKMNAKRAEPGTRVQVSITHDLEKTLGNIKQFTDKYNTINRYMNTQFSVPAGGKNVEGKLAGDGNLRSMMRAMQGEMTAPLGGGKYRSLAEIGITTNAKSGELEVDEKKLKGALATDYEEVAKLFTVNEEGGGEGVAARVANAVKRFQDPVSGVMTGRLNSLDKQIHDQDKQIEQQSQRLDDRKENLERQFSNLQGKLSNLNAQGDLLNARFGGDQAAQAAPAQQKA